MQAGETSNGGGSTTQVPLRVLLVEDDPRVVQAIRQEFRHRAIDLTHKSTLAEAQQTMEAGTRLDAIILDLNLPDGHGGTLAKKCREQGCTVPIIMLTARDAIEDRVAGLGLGADDYICKPFAPAELSARLDAVIRRSRRSGGRNLRYANIELDLLKRTLRRGPMETTLSSRELDLMAFFLLHPEEVLPKEHILREVWGGDAEHDGNVLQVYTNYLRNKLEQKGDPRVLHTVRGVGYVLSQEEPGL